jgi:hypothetical protein
MSYRDLYDKLVSGEIPYFLYNYPSQTAITECFVDIYAGSFNPRHEIHNLVYRSALAEMVNWRSCEHSLFLFEISLVRRNKENLSYDELMKRLEQFTEPVIITNVDRFVKKTGLLCECGLKSVKFHIGIDTASRIIEDDTFEGVQGINASFYVYPRDGVGLENLMKIPNNFLKGEYCDEYICGISSTAIRNGE